jgi:chromosome segregation ATPase
VEAKEAAETVEAKEAAETVEAKEAAETVEAKEAAETIEATYGFKTPLEEQITEDPRELQKRIRTLENKLRKAIADGLRTKGQLEKLKIDMAALKSQWVREKEETGKYRNRVRELEGEREEKEKELEGLKQKLEQKKILIPQKPKEQPQRRELQKVKGESNGEIDLASYQGRKALIFAERDNEVDNRLNALGIIPIWAMEIDWNRPRRRMSTCEIVLYKMNDKKIKKLDEIRDIAKYWNIPCNELLNI